MHRQFLLRACAWLMLAVVTVRVVGAVRNWQRSERERRALFTARAIGRATGNLAATIECWPSRMAGVMGDGKPLRWRTALWNFVEPARARTPEELTTYPAGVFHLTDPASSATNVYAIVGPGTVFSTDQACAFDDAPPETLLFVSGAPSTEPWHQAGNVAIEDLDREGRSIKEVLGEAIEGKTFLIYRDGEVKVLAPSEPATELARQARWRSRAAR